MTKDHSRSLERAVYDSLSQSSNANSVSPSDIHADCDGVDLFVTVTPRSSRSPDNQLSILAGAVRACVNHAHGSQAMDENGKFTAAPEGDSITALVVDDDILRVDFSNPDELHDISQSRLMTRVAMQMERV